MRDPLEAEFFATQADTDQQALQLYRRSPEEAQKFLTELARERMGQVMEMYRTLRGVLITKYTNNHEWL
jgi:dipeptidase